ncbi:hydrogenase expression/formation protein HypE [Clostridium beijerinckii]|jgi:hydrogenase expression/formation protein HypE|uniref:Hydrogenase expression/formation protein HypE n=2 Tax=Clostridium beijerinckii TaxID=1520 RepID=A0AAE2V1Z1_CLOBE|nr:hydrogenase expression/formation protein HypE [Clostridium beijerinckii]ABR35145.1 hydrogenase expression/formation protein HypE [Clostridium beijerinckii NCIMB 8052]AIU04360.1 hydrogenase expression/formation protein HypE [Clostridium beijerinckii ATCC 35702]MBF7810222.1 hydrogenase expression/formation protein HypE [Clostridium beijerinckii]NOW90864.1 hydrogenase expression/formation protein HypE [Clostridium beijerinckii]NRT23465.1 hydrogenase expression/formation protein HypE [Clostridi
MNKMIKLIHGDGGKHTKILIEQLFYKYFNNNILLQEQDSATFTAVQGKMAFTTDSFVVKPLFFSGGNIGKLAVCGTINDLAVSGAKPFYLSSSFIIEEGFSMQSLEEIVKSMGQTCLECGAKIVTGDTKVVEKGSVDGIFINTSGIGYIINGYEVKPIEEGDKIIVTGEIGEHGTTIAVERYNLKVKGDYKSDCAPLFHFIEELKEQFPSIKIMRDPTRGGLSTVLHEFSSLCKLGIHLIEKEIPISESVKAINNLLGLDPLYMACEGRMVLVVKETEAKKVLDIIRSIDQGKGARIIGEFIKDSNQNIFIENGFGGKRVVSPLEVSMLPRIC